MSLDSSPANFERWIGLTVAYAKVALNPSQELTAEEARQHGVFDVALEELGPLNVFAAYLAAELARTLARERGENATPGDVLDEAERALSTRFPGVLEE
jgi:hypothetical protein